MHVYAEGFYLPQQKKVIELTGSSITASVFGIAKHLTKYNRY